MKNNFVSEGVLVTALIIILVFLVNPFGLWMPTMFHMLLVALVAALFFLFAGFLWREHADDEREELHRFIAARFAYFFGTAILVAGIVAQGILDDVSPWLPLALGGMLLGKILGRIYAEHTH